MEPDTQEDVSHLRKMNKLTFILLYIFDTSSLRVNVFNRTPGGHGVAGHAGGNCSLSFLPHSLPIASIP